MSEYQDALRQRCEALRRAGEYGWIALLIATLLVSALIIPDPWQWSRSGGGIDVPGDLAPDLKLAGFDIRESHMLSDGWPPIAYQLFSIQLWWTIMYAAVRGRWRLYFASYLLLLIPIQAMGLRPAAPFATGIVDSLEEPAIAGAIIACIRAVVAKRMSLLKPIIAVAAGVLAVQILTSMPVPPQPVMHMPYTVHGKATAAAERQNVETTLTALSPRHPAAAAYMRAQIAYMYADKPALLALGPIAANGFQHNAGTAERLKRLEAARRTAAGQAPPHADLWNTILLAIIATGYLLLIVLSLLNGRMEARMRRIGKLDIELQRLSIA